MMYYFKYTELNELFDNMYRTIEQITKMDGNWLDEAFAVVHPQKLEVKYLSVNDYIADQENDNHLYDDLYLYPVADHVEYDEDADEFFIDELSLVHAIKQDFLNCSAREKEYIPKAH